MSGGIFITGTDTGIGKTVGSAALMHALRKHTQVCYWKPIQTGIERDDDTKTVRNLGGCSEGEVFDEGVRLPRPLSPHLSARLAGKSINLEPLVQLCSRIPRSAFRIVEGAGGALVPINDSEMMTDLMTALELPIVVVARSGLGTINHTLLTLESLRARGLTVTGVIMVGERNLENRRAIERFGQVEVLGEMPPFDNLKRAALREWTETGLNVEPLLVYGLSSP